RREDLDERPREVVEFVARVDVLVQRRAIELREDVDAAQAGVNAVRDRDIDDPVFASEWHSRLRPFLGQRKESRARAAAHDDGESAFGDGGRSHIGKYRARRATARRGWWRARRRMSLHNSVTRERAAFWK